MSLQNNHIIYTAEDIKKYLSGTLSPAEMHQMEKAALDDTFLADAMEGYAGLRQEDWEEKLALLKNNFPEGKTAKVISLKRPHRAGFWKVAAAVLILWAGVAITYQITNNQPGHEKSIAVAGQKMDSVNNITAESRSADTSYKIISPEPAKTTAKSIQQPNAIIRDQRSLPGNKIPDRPRIADGEKIGQEAGRGYEDNQSKRNKEVAADIAPPAFQNSTEQNKVEGSKPNDYKPAESNYKKSGPVTTKKFTAQVVDKDGAALPFSNISVNDKNTGTYADVKGNFSLLSPDSILNIQVKSVGYVSRNYRLQSGTSQKIVLTEDELALKEKVLATGRMSATPKKRGYSVLAPDSVIDVEPEDGWDNYDTYITNNLLLPDDPFQKNVHGEVEVSFNVQSNGALSDVKIDRSLCNDCDKAALRVIRDGPRWKVKKGGEGSAKLTLRF